MASLSSSLHIQCFYPLPALIDDTLNYILAKLLQKSQDARYVILAYTNTLTFKLWKEKKEEVQVSYKASKIECLLKEVNYINQF